MSAALQQYRHRLGVRTDAEIAQWAGVPVHCVTAWRHRLGIPSTTATRAAQWARVAHRLGTEPDRSIADEIGVCRRAVVYQRKKRNIKPYIRGNNE